MLSILKTSNRPIIALIITHNSLQVYDIAHHATILNQQTYSNNTIIFMVHRLAQLIKDYCRNQKLLKPLLVINPMPYLELLCESTYVLDEYHDLVHRAIILPSCLKLYASFLKPEAVFQYHLLVQLTGINESIITSSTALYIYFLQSIGKSPPNSCTDMKDLQLWIKEALTWQEDSASILFRAITHLGNTYGNH